jgi:tripartite-type tricarboxylate transporter receptor subunit TctC
LAGSSQGHQWPYQPNEFGLVLIDLKINTMALSETRMKFISALSVCIFSALSLFFSITAHAAWPDEHPIALVVPFPAGGTTDMVGRLLATQMGKALNQSIVIDNRGGAGGTIGAAYAARSKPDGYTLFLATTAHTIAPSIYNTLPYDFIKDFVPVTLVASLPHVLITNPKLPINSVADLIKYAKAHPDQLNFGSAGIGSTDHLSMELFNRDAGIKLKHIPYKGDDPMMTDLMSGQIQVAMPPSGIAVAPIQAHTVKALAVSTAKPSVYFPGLPIIRDAARLPDYTFETWYALMVPTGTPPEVQAKLYQAVLVALKSPEMQKALHTISGNPGGEPSKDVTRLIVEQTQEWHNILKPEK